MDHSTAHDAGYAIGMLVGHLLFYGGLIALGVYFGNRLARNRRGVVFVRWPVGVALTVIVLLLAGQCAAPTKAQGVPGVLDLSAPAKAGARSAACNVGFRLLA